MYMEREERIRRTQKKHEQRKKYHNFAGRTPHVCLETPKRGSSCRCCSNARKSEKGVHKLTLQERRFYEATDNNSDGLA
jgi:hypothetical protein